MSAPDAPWAPTHVLFQDLYDIREARGDNHIYPIDIAPDRCMVCGAPHATCVDNHGNYTPLQITQNIIQLPEEE